jgi:hypothetical protein
LGIANGVVGLQERINSVFYTCEYLEECGIIRLNAEKAETAIAACIKREEGKTLILCFSCAVNFVCC